MNKQKGFTIIELIVVIAIIAVLAAIVLVNVTSYINKGRDASVKGNLNTLVTNAAIYFDDTTQGNGDYDGFVGDADMYTPASTAISNAGYTLVSFEATSNNGWCGCVQLKADTTKYFCVDTDGSKVESTTACATTCTAASYSCN